ncbi:MAG: adenylate kinase [Anaerolineales bacterium]
MEPRSFRPMERVVVIGTSCSGKTTFASQLADKLAITHTELDVLHWLPDWQMRQLEEFRSLVAEVAVQDRWVIDGNYGKVRDIIWPRATHLVWLNYPFWTIFSRALRRTLRRVVTREELFAGNRESLSRALFNTESIVWWVLRTYKRRRREYPQLFQMPQNKHLEIIELKNQIEADRFVTGIQPGHGPLSH